VLVCKILAATLLVAAAAGCTKSPETALQQLMESRRLSADLLVHFTKADDASNRAVMADTDEASAAFAREAEQALQAIQTNVKALTPILTDLGYSTETRLVADFNTRFAEYQALDKTILQLAVENTNLKAQRMSFGPAQGAADTVRQSLEAVTAADAARDTWRLKALVATAVLNVSEIQVLQAPHIAEANDEVMTRLEKRMAASKQQARESLNAIARLASPASRPQVDAATSALDRFMSINTQIVDLSRRNTNVRSTALSLGQKRSLTAACESSLQALQDALSRREFTATR
jgi:hypothetical protein